MGLDLGIEQDITHGGQSYHLGRLTLAPVERFFEWVRRQVGDPFAVAERFLDKLPPAQALELVKEAKSAKDALDGLDVSSELFRSWAAKLRGQAELMHQLSEGKLPVAAAFDYLMRKGEEAARAFAERQEALGRIREAKELAAALDGLGIDTGALAQVVDRARLAGMDLIEKAAGKVPGGNAVAPAA